MARDFNKVIGCKITVQKGNSSIRKNSILFKDIMTQKASFTIEKINK